MTEREGGGEIMVSSQLTACLSVASSYSTHPSAHMSLQENTLTHSEHTRDDGVHSPLVVVGSVLTDLWREVVWGANAGPGQLHGAGRQTERESVRVG